MAAHSGELERDPEGWLMRNGLMGSKRAAAGQPLADDAGTMRVPVGEVPDGLWKAQIGQESGGKQFGKDGKPLVKSWAELQQQGLTAPAKSGAPIMGIYN